MTKNLTIRKHIFPLLFVSDLLDYYNSKGSALVEAWKRTTMEQLNELITTMLYYSGFLHTKVLLEMRQLIDWQKLGPTRINFCTEFHC